jgi:hypothetical protein
VSHEITHNSMDARNRGNCAVFCDVAGSRNQRPKVHTDTGWHLNLGTGVDEYTLPSPDLALSPQWEPKLIATYRAWWEKVLSDAEETTGSN